MKVNIDKQIEKILSVFSINLRRAYKNQAGFEVPIVHKDATHQIKQLIKDSNKELIGRIREGSAGRGELYQTDNERKIIERIYAHFNTLLDQLEKEQL